MFKKSEVSASIPLVMLTQYSEPLQARIFLVVNFLLGSNSPLTTWLAERAGRDLIVGKFGSQDASSNPLPFLIKPRTPRNKRTKRIALCNNYRGEDH